MKTKIILLLIILTNFLSLKSQISIRENIKTNPVYKPVSYDSLSMFHYNYESYENSYKGISKKESIKRSDNELLKYIGHKVYFIPYAKEDQNDVSVYTDFHYLNQREISKNKQSDVYKAEIRINTYGSLKITEEKIITPVKEFQGKYFTILDFEFGNADIYSENFIKMILEDDNKDTLYLLKSRQDWSWGRYPDFIIVSYYEKQKELLVGKSFIASFKTHETLPGQIEINSGEIVEVLNDSEWLCTSLDYLKVESNYLELYLILKNSVNQEIKVRIIKEDSDKTNVLTLKSFIEKDEYLRQQEFAKLESEARQKKIEQEESKRKLEEKQRANLILEKFGDYYGNLILDSKIIIGMNQDMCRMSWGAPFEINRTIVLGLVHEQWVYSLKNYLYFENGILTAIQN
jgi:hypothetical protein